MQIEKNYLPLVRINAPEVYEDEHFLRWLNDRSKTQATWHRKGAQPGEYSDIFMTFDGCDGSDSDMPEHIWQMIAAEVRRCAGEIECLIWLTNL